MSQLKNRIERVEDRNGAGDAEAKSEFGGYLLLQDFEMVENEGGEMVEVIKEGIRREFVMYPEYAAKPGERIMGFEPNMITQSEFNSMMAEIMNKSRSI